MGIGTPPNFFVAARENSRNCESCSVRPLCTCSFGFSASACQGQITLVAPSAVDAPILCLHLKSRYTPCCILATRYHLQRCVLRRLEAPWVPAGGSRRHPFEMWWLKSVRTQWYGKEAVYRGKVISLSLSFFSVSQGWFKYSSQHLAFSSGNKKPLV